MLTRFNRQLFTCRCPFKRSHFGCIACSWHSKINVQIFFLWLSWVNTWWELFLFIYYVDDTCTCGRWYAGASTKTQYSMFFKRQSHKQKVDPNYDLIRVVELVHSGQPSYRSWLVQRLEQQSDCDVVGMCSFCRHIALQWIHQVDGPWIRGPCHQHPLGHWNE